MNQHDLRRILKYDPETGVFTWREKTSNKVVVGREAGARIAAGYIVIGIGGKTYYAHRLAYLYMTGEMPRQVDHKDGNRGNNAWSNLRPATHTQNLLNAKLAANSTSGRKGVSWHKGAGKWSAYICAGGRKTHLGLHNSAEEAHAAYLNAAIKIEPEFARAS